MGVRQLRILVIDDEPEIVEIISEEFKYYGHIVIQANSGNLAVEFLKQSFFDVVISDFKMPNGNGLIVLNYVNSIVPRPLFFFISGQADLSVEECIKAGADRFFSKPFDLEIIISETLSLTQIKVS